MPVDNEAKAYECCVHYTAHDITLLMECGLTSDGLGFNLMFAIRRLAHSLAFSSNDVLT